MPLACFTNETIAVGIFNAPPTLNPPLLLDYSFFTQSHPGSAKQQAEPYLSEVHKSRLYSILKTRGRDNSFKLIMGLTPL